MSDRQLPGNQSATAVTEVPAEGDVGADQILAGVVEPDGEGNGLVLDEVLVFAVDVVDLGKGDGERNLVWRRSREERDDFLKRIQIQNKSDGAFLFLYE